MFRKNLNKKIDEKILELLERGRHYITMEEWEQYRKVIELISLLMSMRGDSECPAKLTTVVRGEATLKEQLLGEIRELPGYQFRKGEPEYVMWEDVKDIINRLIK